MWHGHEICNCTCYRYDNPAGDLVYALKNKRVKNLASLTASEMPEFLRK
jgi:hypothetical protein